MNMLAPRFDVALRPSRSLFNEWLSPYSYFVECEDWMPSSDITETEKSYVVTMELPGIDMKKTDVSYNDGILTVKGEKGKESMEGESCYCAERYSGSFERTFRIPGKVNSDKIDARYKDGILKLMLPKAEESIPKKITVH
jgi:HSP20 family protein